MAQSGRSLTPWYYTYEFGQHCAYNKIIHLLQTLQQLQTVQTLGAAPQFTQQELLAQAQQLQVQLQQAQQLQLAQQKQQVHTLITINKRIFRFLQQKYW